jgi:hypothetical protein
VTGEFRLRVRLRVRLRCRLRLRCGLRALPAFPCTRAAFRGFARGDISVSASESSPCHPLTRDPLRLALRSRSDKPPGAPWANWLANGRCVTLPVGGLVTCRCRCWLPLAYRVVAGRRCLVAPSPLAVPARSPLALPTPAGRSCAVPPSLSRRLAGRFGNGRRAAPRARGRGGARR